MTMNAFLRSILELLASPGMLFAGSVLAMAVLFVGRRFFVRPIGSLLLLLGIAGMAAAVFAHPNMAAKAMQPDNLPVLGILGLLFFFTWLGARQAVTWDDADPLQREAARQAASTRIFTWPDLVYSELICAVLLSAVLIGWSLLAAAPLEEPANPALTPNPAKAPWYFLGMQELLYYCDGWMAGLTIPIVAVVGLMAIPYLDKNPRGSGYYTIRERRLAYLVFQFGFWMLGVWPIVVGTFFRGPNWQFEGFSLASNGEAVRAVTGGHGISSSATFWIAYFLAFPAILSATLFRSLWRTQGTVRTLLFLFLLAAMLALPLRMVATWVLAGRL